MSEVLAGHREVWTSTHGRAGVLHVALDGEAVAACSPARGMTGNRRIILGDLEDAADVPEHMRCRRRACAIRWPAQAEAAGAVPTTPEHSHHVGGVQLGRL